jgi:Na+/H+ antiporter NhaD/arsenite permease-like protein
MGVAIIAMCSDALINQRPPLSVIKRVDWSVLLMFFGMFVWLYGLNKSNAPRYIWNRLRVAEMMKPSKTVWSYFVFYAFILICSNIFSNVPLTIIVLELLVPCIDQLELVLYLAWISTIAGNLTLFGSVANLIVAQKAMTTIGYHLGFFKYLRYGFVTTLVLSILGMAVTYALLQI